MQNEELVKEWIQLAEMDYQTSMNPHPGTTIVFGMGVVLSLR